MVIYIIGTSGVTFILTLGLVTFNRYRKRIKKKINVHLVIERDNNENDAAQSNQAFESVYDTIDESQMIDMPTHHSISITESSSDSSAENFVADGYLNPYQPMVPDKEVHDYLNVSSVGENGVPQNLIKKGDHVTIHRRPNHNDSEVQQPSTSISFSSPSNIVPPAGCCQLEDSEEK